MFDLKNDPREMNNIFKEEGYQDLTEDMLTKLKEIKHRYKDYE